jgi:hypothetical protein
MSKEGLSRLGFGEEQGETVRTKESEMMVFKPAVILKVLD